MAAGPPMHPRRGNRSPDPAGVSRPHRTILFLVRFVDRHVLIATFNPE